MNREKKDNGEMVNPNFSNASCRVFSVSAKSDGCTAKADGPDRPVPLYSATHNTVHLYFHFPKTFHSAEHRHDSTLTLTSEHPTKCAASKLRNWTNTGAFYYIPTRILRLDFSFADVIKAMEKLYFKNE
jgi:hypothetical protein